VAEQHQAPTNDLAVLGFCELVGLMFGLPPSEAFYRGDPISVRMVMFGIIGIVFAVIGPLWPRLKQRLPRRFAARFVRVASDFKWWMAILLGFYLWQALNGLTTETHHAAVVASALRSQEQQYFLRSTPTSTPTSPPIFLNVGPLYFAGIVKNRTTEAQVNTLVKPYLGKWMKIESTVKNVRSIGFEGQIEIVFEFDQGGRIKDKIIAQAAFDKSWFDRVSQLSVGDQVSVTGELVTVFQDGGFVLQNCSFTLESSEKSNSN